MRSGLVFWGVVEGNSSKMESCWGIAKMVRVIETCAAREQTWEDVIIL